MEDLDLSTKEYSPRGSGWLGSGYDTVLGFLDPGLFFGALCLGGHSQVFTWGGNTAEELSAHFDGRDFSRIHKAIFWFTFKGEKQKAVVRRVGRQFGDLLTVPYSRVFVGYAQEKNFPEGFVKMQALVVSKDKEPAFVLRYNDVSPVLLGIVMSGDVEGAKVALDRLVPDDFKDARHRAIFDTLQKHYIKTKDPFMACANEELLTRAGKLEAVGGEIYIHQLERHYPGDCGVGFLNAYIDVLKSLQIGRWSRVYRQTGGGV